MIKYLISKDDKFKLRKEKNIKGKIPMEIEKADSFMSWLYTIWDAVSDNMTVIVQQYIKDKSY